MAFKWLDQCWFLIGLVERETPHSWEVYNYAQKCREVVARPPAQIVASLRDARGTDGDYIYRGGNYHQMKFAHAPHGLQRLDARGYFVGS